MFYFYSHRPASVHVYLVRATVIVKIYIMCLYYYYLLSSSFHFTLCSVSYVFICGYLNTNWWILDLWEHRCHPACSSFCTQGLCPSNPAAVTTPLTTIVAVMISTMTTPPSPPPPLTMVIHLTKNVLLHRQFDKLQRDLNQIEEAFRKLKNFEHDAGESIKNIEFCVDDISKIVVEASNDAFPIQARLSAIKKDALKSWSWSWTIHHCHPKCLLNWGQVISPIVWLMISELTYES